MRLIQLNAWGGRLEHQVKDLVKKYDPDILCLQESIDINTHGIIFANTNNIAQSANMKYIFHSPLISFKMLGTSAHFGNTIMSKFKIDNEETIFTNLEYKQDFNFERDDYNVRNLQYANVMVDGKKINVLNHHGLHVPDHKNGNAETERQMTQIYQFIKQLNGPIILTGDFNLSPSSPSLTPLNNLLTNLSAENNLKTTRTYLTSKIEVCDYIFVSSDVKVDKFEMLSEVVSDHAALLLDFSI